MDIFKDNPYKKFDLKPIGLDGSLVKAVERINVRPCYDIEYRVTTEEGVVKVIIDLWNDQDVDDKYFIGKLKNVVDRIKDGKLLLRYISGLDEHSQIYYD